MHAMTKRKEPPIDREAERRKPDIRGATPERLARAGDDFEVGDDPQVKIVRLRDIPIDRMWKRGAIDGKQHSALQRFREHWYNSGLIPSIGSVDLNRVFASDPSNFGSWPKSEAQANHRSEWRRACGLLEHRERITVDNVVCSEQPLEIAGYALGWLSKPQAIAAASEIIRNAGVRFAKLWGIG